MELEQIKAFLAVVRSGSFSKAARAIYRSQPAVTARIQALERELGTPLFDRLGRQVKLAAAGQALLENAGPLIEQWDGLKNRVQESIGGILRGPVRLGSGEAALLYLLPGPVRAFRKRYPQVEILVRNQPLQQTLEMLKTGELDFGFRSLAAAPPDMSFRPSRTFERVLITPRDHPILKESRITLKALSRHSLIMPWKGSTTRQLVERAFEEADLPIRIGLEAGGTEVIKRYVALGLGIAIVLEFCLKPEDRTVLGSRPVRHLFGQDTYGIVVRKGKRLSRASQLLIKEIDPKFLTKDSQAASSE